VTAVAPLPQQAEFTPLQDAVPLPDHSFGVCPVCSDEVFDDPRHERLDHTAPVKMPDGDWTHAGCEDDYCRVVAELEARHGADPLPSRFDLDEYLGVSVSAESLRHERERERFDREQPARVNLRARRGF
jgi:hypothetical protein